MLVFDRKGDVGYKMNDFILVVWLILYIFHLKDLAECQICLKKRGQLSKDLLCFNVYHLCYGNVKNENQKWDIFSTRKKTWKRRHVNHVTKFAIKEVMTGICCPTVIFSNTRISFNIVDILHDVINNDIL